MSEIQEDPQNESGSSHSSSSNQNQIHDYLTTPIQQNMKPFFHSGSGQVEADEARRIKEATEQFNIFLHEALENFEDADDKLFQTEASEIRSHIQDQKSISDLNIQKADGVGTQQIYQDDNIIRDSIFALKKIENEVEQLLENFIMIAKNMDQNDKANIKRMKDIFEAFNYEIAIRAKDKSKLYEKILFKENHAYKHIRMLENEYRKLEKNYSSIRKFHEIRSLRQTGRYKGNPQNLQKVKPGANISQNSLGQKFMTLNTSAQNHELLLNEKGINKNNAITSIQTRQYSQQAVLKERDKQKNEEFKNSEKVDNNAEIVIDETSVYDWIVDIDLITSVAKEGWKVYLSKKFADSQKIFTKQQNQQQQDGQMQQGQNAKAAKSTSQQYYGLMNVPSGQARGGWEGATVAVVGLYDKGKTFVLNNLTQSNLPSGKKVNTKGISFKNVNVDSGTHLILVDTAGSYSPVKIQNELSIVEKEATEMFIMDLVFEISDYFICVVNDFTSLDQRYLDRLSRNLQNSPNKTFREIIVIHNLKEVESPEILEHVWSTQVTHIYQNGSIQRTQVAANNPLNGQLQEKHVLWFKTQYTRHVCLVNDDSYLGISINPWVFSLLKYWLKAVFVPVNRPFSVVDSIITFSKVKLTQYFRTSLSLKINDTSDLLVKTIVTEQEVVDNVRIPQVSIDSSGLIMARPDSFLPATDIIATDKYIIYMDVPGLTKDEIVVYRQNIVTIIKGIRKKPYIIIPINQFSYSEIKNEKLEKSERKYGEFALSFKIPEIYERKWSVFTVENGVLTIIYDKDKDDQIVRSRNKDTKDSQSSPKELM